MQVSYVGVRDSVLDPSSALAGSWSRKQSWDSPLGTQLRDEGISSGIKSLLLNKVTCI